MTAGAPTRIQEAVQVLRDLGLPSEQQNDRSALCLLALINLPPDQPWSAVGSRLIGITPIMDWVRDHYGRPYAPNTRETFRRQTMHQFVQAGIVLYNPDDPQRPVNSPKAVYQIEPTLLPVLQAFGTPAWSELLTTLRDNLPSLVDRYAQARTRNLVPVRIPDGSLINLSPGAHSELIGQIIERFAPEFVPGAHLVYAGDTGEKWGFFNERLMAELGLSLDAHGKMPDVILYDADRQWLILVESVTSHGPVDAKRHIELKAQFGPSSRGLVYVTAFPDRATMARYLPQIAWETEVWTADAPSHLIHFDGERFLGPYEGHA